MEKRVKISKKADKQLGKIKDKQFSKFIERKTKVLLENPEFGTKISRRQTPSYYADVFGVDNLWKIDLPRGWRITYTLSKEYKLLNITILEILSHKEYEERFRY